MAVTIICTLMYGQSQQANRYQVALARTLRWLGDSNSGIKTLRNIVVAAHPNTISRVFIKRRPNTEDRRQRQRRIQP